MAKIYIGQTIVSDDDGLKAEILGDTVTDAFDTLTEIEGIIGDDENIAGTIIAGLGNRLRIDIDAQALTATQLVNAKTNLQLHNVDNQSKAFMFTDSAFTGTPTAPTAAPGTNDTQIATTQFVTSAVSSEDTIAEMNDVTLTSLADGELLVSSSGNFINQTLAEAGIAPAANPTFTGSITGTLGTAAQTAITSVGALSGLSVIGTMTVEDEGGDAGLSVNTSTHTYKLGDINGTLAGAHLSIISGGGGSPSTGIFQNCNVGIGKTPAASVELDVNGDIAASGSITGATLAGTLSTATQTAITSVGTLSSLSISDDLTVDTSTLKVDSTNNRVGIGVAAPTSRLHVKETSGGNVVRQLRLHNDSTSMGTGTGIAFTNSTTETYDSATIHSDRSVLADGSLVFSTASSSSSGVIERMRINATGEVGIGKTATVGVELDVSGDIAASGNLSIDTNILKVDATLNKVGIKHTPVAASADLHVNGSMIVANGAEKGLSIIPGAYQYNIGDIDNGENGTYLEIDAVNTFARLHSGGLAIGKALTAGKDLDVNGDALMNSLTVDGVFTVTGDCVIENTIELSGGAGIEATDTIQTTGAIQPGVFADASARDTAIPSPTAGMMVFLTAGTKFQGYTGSAWVDFN